MSPVKPVTKTNLPPTKQSPKLRWWWLLLVLLFLFFLILLFIWWWRRSIPIPPTPANTVEQYLEDETLWLPDAIVESNEQILEMKFGN